MYVDVLGRFSNAQALTATAASTDSIDLGFDGNLGIGEPMVVVISLDVVADDTTGDETYVAALQADDNSGFSSAADIASVTITRGDVAGTKYVMFVPADLSAERFLRLNFTLGGTTPTATVTAFLTPASMVQNNVVYPIGYTVS